VLPPLVGGIALLALLGRNGCSAARSPSRASGSRSRPPPS
jgi:ABC-type molybdate transport system permease subunit